MDFSNYKFRCSALGTIMTNDRSGKGMGETCKKYLMQVYIKEKYGRDREVINKYINKGLLVEEDSLTLYSLVKKTFFVKNEKTFSNDFIVGTPDIITGEEVIDIKSSWSLETFMSVIHQPINKDYYYQLQGYMALTNLQKARLAYCLVSTPEPLILDEKNRIKWKMGVSDPDTDEVYIQSCEYLETAMRFDDIPKEERYIEFLLNRIDADMELVYERVKLCRQFLNELSK